MGKDDGASRSWERCVIMNKMHYEILKVLI